ncbi:tyrosine-protein kinase ITK/TSK-like, partial [Oculina patagonica]
GKEGCFVVRNSSKEGMYTLSVLHGDHVRHYHIKEENGQLYISDRHRYPTVSELVNYHQHNSGGLVTRLRQPPSFGQAPVAAFGHGNTVRTVALEGHRNNRSDCICRLAPVNAYCERK